MTDKQGKETRGPMDSYLRGSQATGGENQQSSRSPLQTPVPCGESTRVQAETHHPPLRHRREQDAGRTQESDVSTRTDKSGDESNDQEEEQSEDGGETPHTASPIRRKRSHDGKRPQEREPAGLQFLDQEANDGNRSAEGSEVDEEDNNADDFVASDESVEPPSPSEYRRLDSSLREQGAPRAVEPYFPLAFAECRERPLDFNFDLFLLDNLSLPVHISKRGTAEVESSDEQAVIFESAEAAIRYCRDNLESGWKVTRPIGENPRQSQTRLSCPQIDKWQLFKKDGRRISKTLKSGLDDFDANLHLVRMDRYGNIMIWDAPQWSAASVQFTHGFPRRMIAESHGGFLPGNITVTSMATNLTLRRLAVCDVASLVSYMSTAGSGLSLARLLNLRYAAIRYKNTAYSPQYLIAAMVEFGVSFATFKPLDAETLDALSASLTSGWKAVEGAEDSASDDSETSTEPLIECEFTEAVLRQIGKYSQGTEGDGDADSRDALTTLLAQFNRQNSDSDPESEEAEEVRTQCATGSRGRSVGRKRKAKSNSSSGRPKMPRNSQAKETPAGNSRENTGSIQADDLFQLESLNITGLKKDVFPDTDSWKRLIDFFRQHKPVPQERILAILSDTSACVWPGDPEHVQDATSAQLAQAKQQKVSQEMATLFGICRESCTCSEETCDLKEGQFVQLAQRDASPCAETTTCSICAVFSRHLQLCNLMSRAHTSKNARMSQLLASSVALHQIYDLAITPQLPPGDRVQRKQTVKELLCRILDCKRNRLQCLKHIGQLAQLLPKLLCIQLATGHSLFWDEIRKVARTVNSQPNHQAKLAAIVAIRRQLPSDSPWKAFLTSESTAEEEAIMQRFVS